MAVRSAENRNTFVACAFFMMGFFVVLAYIAKRWYERVCLCRSLLLPHRTPSCRYGMCGMLFMFAFSAALGMGCSSTELSERSSQVHAALAFAISWAHIPTRDYLFSLRFRTWPITTSRMRR